MRLAALPICVLACAGTARPVDVKAPEVRVVVDATEVADGGYAREDIDRVIAPHAAQFRACYAKRARASQRLGAIAFDIGADGVVSNVVIRGGGEVASCLDAGLRALRFPAKGSRARITYPAVPGLY